MRRLSRRPEQIRKQSRAVTHRHGKITLDSERSFSHGVQHISPGFIAVSGQWTSGFNTSGADGFIRAARLTAQRADQKAMAMNRICIGIRSHRLVAGLPRRVTAARAA